MNEEYYESKEELAQCFLTNLAEKIKIPTEIYDKLSKKGENVVAVIPGKSKKISFFITNASQVLFIRLKLDKDSLNDKFFISLRSTLKELKLSNLFSTGLCFKDEICVWEGVFEFSEEQVFDEIQEQFKNIAHVQKAEFQKIEVE